MPHVVIVSCILCASWHLTCLLPSRIHTLLLELYINQWGSTLSSLDSSHPVWVGIALQLYTHVWTCYNECVFQIFTQDATAALWCIHFPSVMYLHRCEVVVHRVTLLVCSHSCLVGWVFSSLHHPQPFLPFKSCQHH